MKVNERNNTLHDWSPLQIPSIRWNWSQVMKPCLFRENVDTRIGHKFPTWKLTIERKSFMIGHPYRSPPFDGIGPRSWNLACFEETLTTELDTNFQSEINDRNKNPRWLATFTDTPYLMELVPCPETSPVSRKRWPHDWSWISITKINDRKKTVSDWPILQIPSVGWNLSQVLKPRMFRENVDHMIGHKFPA